eukprot:jgi/Botrbrau1/17726/Bobra.0166s0147.2
MKSSLSTFSHPSVHRHCLGIDGTPTEVYEIRAQGEPRLQVVMLPGNPGSAGFYIPFLKYIYHALDRAVDVYAVSYAGHSWYAGQLDSEVYTLEEQINHKTRFLEQHVLLPGKAPAVVLAHSIGTYIAIHAVHRTEKKVESQASQSGTPPPVAKVIGMFPFFSVDPTSIQQATIKQAAGWSYLMGGIANLVGRLPERLQSTVARLLFREWDAHAVETSLDLLKGHVARNAFYLGHHEFKTLTAPADWWLLQHYGKRFSLLYASNDHWFPPAAFNDLLATIPDVDAHFVEDVHHAFCVSHKMSNKVADKTIEIIRSALEQARKKTVLDGAKQQ